MRNFLLIALIAWLPLLASSQVTMGRDGGGSDQQLAEHYYSNGEFDKAVVYYERLFDKNPSKFNFTRYLECLEQTGEEKTAEKLLKKQIKLNKGDQEYPILLAKFYEKQGNTERANTIYSEMIDALRPSARDIVQLYNAFKTQGKSDLAFETLTKGRKLLKDTYPLNGYFAEYYGSINENKLMIDEYLGLMDYHSSYKTQVQTILARVIDFDNEESEEYQYLKEQLIMRSQKDPNDNDAAEMVTWLFIQRRNFQAAFLHIKAIDKRTDGGGYRVLELGEICTENKDYQTAQKCFQYVVDQGEDSRYYVRAQNALLNARFLQVTTLRDYTKEDLYATQDAFEEAMERVGKSGRTLPLMLQCAHIMAFYADNHVAAIVLLNEALELTDLTDMQRAEVKMQLADIYVLKGDIWEAALLYAQVDKDFKYESVGHEAKFKNARIFYYDGEFNYAQSQLDVLKQSTSKLIANDALKLSLLITDNFGLDSNWIAMNWFAQGDLLIEQHQYDEAFLYFDSIIKEYPAHGLGDEIQLKKAYAMQLRGKWNDAVDQLEELLKFYSQDILADDALFQLGDIYENRLMDGKKAMGYYRTILFEHRGSLYTEESRKRFQKLREIYGSDELKSSEEPSN